MMLILLWMIILGVALLTYIAYPIFENTPTEPVEIHTSEIRRQILFQERQRSYAALVELDEDYETGKLSEADYNELRTALLQEIAHVIQQFENSTMTDVEAEIEGFKQEKRS